MTCRRRQTLLSLRPRFRGSTARRAWNPPTDWTPVYREIPQADYRLVLEVDHRVNRDGIRAELNQGILTLTLPKSEAVKPRRIEIKG
jgi:HSP20 family protein